MLGKRYIQSDYWKIESLCSEWLRTKNNEDQIRRQIEIFFSLLVY